VYQAKLAENIRSFAQSLQASFGIKSDQPPLSSTHIALTFRHHVATSRGDDTHKQAQTLQVWGSSDIPRIQLIELASLTV
jgi:hypothetical protein